MYRLGKRGGFADVQAGEEGRLCRCTGWGRGEALQMYRLGKRVGFADV